MKEDIHPIAVNIRWDISLWSQNYFIGITNVAFSSDEAKSHEVIVSRLQGDSFTIVETVQPKIQLTLKRYQIYTYIYNSLTFDSITIQTGTAAAVSIEAILLLSKQLLFWE